MRLHTEELARADREQFVDWLRESAVHVVEMLRVAKVHNTLEEFQGWLQIADGPDDGGDDENVVSLPHPGSASSPASAPSLSDWQMRGKDAAFPGTTRRRLWIGALAAGLATIAILAILLLPQPRGQTIQTERGERREVALADGTTVRAIGTAFGVEHRKQDVIVTVAEGKVGVFMEEIPTPRDQPPAPSDGEGHQDSSPSNRVQHLEGEGPAQKAAEASASPRKKRGGAGV